MPDNSKLSIAVTGANGFIGSHLIPKLIKESLSPRTCLSRIYTIVRNEKKGEMFKGTPAIIKLGDVSDVSSLQSAFSGVDVIIHLVAIIAEEGDLTYEKVIIQGTRNVVEAAKRAGVKRVIYVSGLGVESDALIGHFRAKWQAEQIIQKSGLEYIIFRPSFVLGPGDYFTMELVRQVKTGEIKVYGTGEYKMQPVYIEDFLELFYRAAISQTITNRIFDLGGPEPMSYNQLIDTVVEIVGVKCKKVFVPVESVTPDIMSSDELYILTHDYICDSSIVAKAYGIPLTSIPQAFAKIIKSSLKV